MAGGRKAVAGLQVVALEAVVAQAIYDGVAGEDCGLDRQDFKEGELGLCDFKENEGNG